MSARRPTSRICRSRWRPRSAPAARRPRTSWNSIWAGCSCAGRLIRRNRALLASVARVVLVGQRGTLAIQLDGYRRPGTGPDRAEGPRAPRRARTEGAGFRGDGASARPRVLQRARRLRRRCREYVTILGQDNRLRHRGSTSSPIRGLASRWRRGQRLHMVGQQPGEPAHALVQRSGQRPPG